MRKTNLNILLLMGVALYCTGCNVRVGGRLRPLVHAEPLQGDLSWVVEDRSDEQGTQNNMRKGSNTITQEWLHLKTQGDVYHPDALSYNASLGFGLNQSHLKTEDETGSTSQQQHGTLDDYHVTAQWLKRKPASMNLNAARSEDIIARQFLGSLHTERENQGATVFYRSGQWPMSLQYSRSRTRQDGLTPVSQDTFNREDQRWRYSLSHHLSEHQQVRLEFNRDDTQQRTLASAIHTKTDNATISHEASWGDGQENRLDSFLNVLNQTGAFTFRNRRWQERLHLQHTPNLSTHYDVRLVDIARQTNTSREIRGLAGTEYHLYASLVTNANVFAAETNLHQQGRLRQQGATLAMNYHKHNPWGMLVGGYSGALTFDTQTGSQGVVAVIDEAHTARELEPIELNRVDIDVSSIAVTDANGQVFQEGEDYRLSEQQGRVWITTYTVGGSTPPNFTEGQTFYVDYDYYVEPQRKERTWRQSLTLRQRFDNGLTLGFSRRRQRQWIDSTLTVVTPDEYTTQTWSADYAHKGLYLRAEISQEESTQIPSRARRLEGRYQWVLDRRRDSLSLRAINHWLHFGAPDKRDVTLFQGGLQLLMPLTEMSHVSGQLDYRHENDSRFGHTRGFQLKTELNYGYRRFKVMAGLEVNRLRRLGDEVNGTYVYLRCRREF